MCGKGMKDFRAYDKEYSQSIVFPSIFVISWPAAAEAPSFDKHAMRRLLEGHDIETRDRVFNLMIESDLFVSKRIGDKVLVSPNFNQPRDDCREQTVARVRYLQSKGVFNGWATDRSYEGGLRHLASYETLSMFDHSLIVKIAVHYHLW